MSTIQEQIATNLVAVDKAKKDIKEALVNKGIDIDGVAFGNYASKIDDIEIPKVYTDDYIVELSYPNTITPIAPPQGYDAVKMVGVEATIAFADAEAKGASNQKSKLTTLLVSENGTYTRADGYSEVTVNVPTSSGGDDLAKLIDGTIESVEIPKGVKAIRNRLFKDCVNLTKVTIPESVTSINYAAFYNCKKISGPIIIPSGATTIEGDAFRYCSSLQFVDLSNCAVIKTGDGAFGECSSLTDALLPVGMKSIAAGMFENCKALTNINLIAPRFFYDNCFKNCTSLKSVDFSNATYIWQGAFAYSGIMDVVLSAPCDNFYISAFEGCTSLTYADLRAGIFKTCFDKVFYNCTMLETILLPDSVTKVNANYAAGCTSLSLISFGSTRTTVPSLSNTNAIPDTIEEILVPRALVNTWKTASNWVKFADKIQGI